MASTINRIIFTFTLLLFAGLILRESAHQQLLASRVGNVTIYITGEVNRPGALTLSGRARRIHAVSLAGGLTSKADLAAVEPARLLTDGETIVVPMRAMDIPVVQYPPLTPSGAISGVRQQVDRPVSVESSHPKIDINRATRADFEQLPGIGPVLAQRIVEARDRTPTGTFASMEDLATIRGIKGKTMARLMPFLELEGL